jgi:hypothetical protein
VVVQRTDSNPVITENMAQKYVAEAFLEKWISVATGVVTNATQ